MPLIVRWPGVSKPGSVCDALLYNIDLSAGLCELTGGQALSWYDGQSLAGFVRGEQPFNRDFLVWGHGLYTLQRAVRTKEHLMVRTYDDFGYEFDAVELYDMGRDRFQTRNLREVEPDRVAKMDHLLNEWLYEQSQKPYAIPDPMQIVLQLRQSL